MINLFSQVELAIMEIGDGWTSVRKGQALAASVMALRPKLTIEIGVFAGKGLMSLALAHKHVNSGKAIGIDPYSRDAAIAGQVNPEDKEWWSKIDYDKFHDAAQANIKKYGCEPFCSLVRKTSDDFEVPIGIGILSIDGNHGVQAVMDVNHFAPNVTVGGLVFMDDLEWAGGAVSKAVKRLEDLGFAEIYRVTDGESWAVLQRKHD